MRLPTTDIETWGDWFKGYGIFALCFVGFPLLKGMLGDGVGSDLVLPVTVVVLSVIAYPLFVRGSTNHWSKDERQWTFQSFVGMHLIAAVVLFLIFTLLPD